MRRYPKRVQKLEPKSTPAKDQLSTSWKTELKPKRAKPDRPSKFFGSQSELREAFLNDRLKIRKSCKQKVFYSFSERYQCIEKLLSKVSLEIKSSPNDPEHKLIGLLQQKRAENLNKIDGGGREIDFC